MTSDYAELFRQLTKCLKEEAEERNRIYLNKKRSLQSRSKKIQILNRRNRK
jgi:hypothetical protein